MQQELPVRPQAGIRATWMRGGTSKGVFFAVDDLPVTARTPGPQRDRLLLRVIGSPDPYAKQIDGLGGATSSTSKVAIVQRSDRADSDIEFLFGAVAIEAPKILDHWVSGRRDQQDFIYTERADMGIGRLRSSSPPSAA